MPVLMERLYSNAIRNAAAVAQGARKRESTRQAPSSDKFASPPIPAMLLVTAPSKNVATRVGYCAMPATTVRTSRAQAAAEVTADSRPVKEAPDQPGGKEFPHKNKLIYDRLTNADEPETERLVPRQENVAVPALPQAPG